MQIDIEKVAALIRDVARDIVIPRWRNLSASQISEKTGPDDLVTIADKECEKALTTRLLAAYPGTHVVGEEGAGHMDELKNGTPSWIIDPIDGTKSYLRKNPLFATQLALMHNGEFILGVSNAPLLGELLYAEKGSGCYLNGALVHVSDVNVMKDAYISYGSLKYFAKTGRLDNLVAVANDVTWARAIGDFWSYHLLAQGKLDSMIEADTKLWDVAALTVIVREAGGTITQLDGSDIDTPPQLP